MRRAGLFLVALAVGSVSQAAEPDPLRTALAEAAAVVQMPELWGRDEVSFEWQLDGVSGDRLSVSGAASAMRVYSAFLRVLEGDPRFEGVAMGEMQRVTWGYRFSFSARFVGGESGWPAAAGAQALVEEAAVLGVSVEQLSLPDTFGRDQGSVSATCMFRDPESLVALKSALHDRAPGFRTWTTPLLDSPIAGAERLKVHVTRRSEQR